MICIVFQSVSLGYFSRGLNTHSMFIYANFLRLYRQTRIPNFACPYKICDIYNVLTFWLAFLTHFGTYGQQRGKLALGNFFTICESPSHNIPFMFLFCNGYRDWSISSRDPINLSIYTEPASVMAE